jgi:hypothetical protein
MDAKLLTQSGWKSISDKFEIKDNGLQRALAAYEKLDETKYDECIKCLASIQTLAAALRKTKEVAASKDTCKYLSDLMGAASAELQGVNSARVQAAKAAAAEKEKEPANPDKDKEGNGVADSYSAMLVAALQKLKSSKDLAFEFVVCDAKPFCGVMIAKNINSQHRALLTKVTGGGTRFLPPGTCAFENGKFDFRTEKPVQGLAKRIQDSIKNFTGKKFAVKAGQESEADGDAQAPGVAADSPGTVPPTGAPAPRGRVSLDQAPQHWHSTRGTIEGILKGLKQAVFAQYPQASQELTAELDNTMSLLNVILDKLDHRLADSLDKAGAAKDPAARQAELKNTKTILAEYINYVKSEPLIAHIDENPLGIPTKLKQTLAESLTDVARAIA